MATLLLLLLLLVVCLVSQSAASTRPSDVDALQGLLRAWQGTPGLLGEWSLHKNADPCGSHWKGVRCCPSMHSVVSLDLSFAGLIGSIPVEIGDLHKLRYLDLSGNQRLTGAIPKEIVNLRLLTILNLSGCDLTGTLPQELSSLSKLKVLNLSDNPSLQDSRNFFESHSRVSSRFIGNGLKFLRHRALLQAVPAVPPTPVVRPPPPVTTPAPNNTATPPIRSPAPVPPPAPPTPVVSPPPVTTPAPNNTATSPNTATPPIRSPAPAPVPPPAPPTPVRTYLMYVGIGAFFLVLSAFAIFCLCRKFGQHKIRGAQRLPPLPRYH